MPGWWFTIESTTSKHFIQQLKIAVENALRSKPDVRAIMRARATKQRFPVSQWVEDLEKLQSSAIEISHKQAAREKRPIFASASTSTILDTPSFLAMLQPRLRSSLRPRSTATEPPNHGKALTTISEGRPRSWVEQTSAQMRALTSFSETRLLPGSGPGLGSKMGPGNKRRVPPPLIFSNSSNSFMTTSSTAFRGQSDGGQADDTRRARIHRCPSSPTLRTVPNSNQQEDTGPPKRPENRRSQTVPELRPTDRKAVRLLGARLSASRANVLISPKNSPSASDESSSPQSHTPKTPVTPPDTPYYTPPLTPTPPPSRMSRAQMSSQTGSTAPSSVNGDNSDSAATSIKAPSSSSAATRSGVASSKVIHTAHGVDPTPNLGPYRFPHGSMPVLSTSNVRGEKPDNILQNVTPFFSDPDKEYENKFKNKLRKLNGKNSENKLCIEEYLLKSEKSWFGKLRAAELSKPSESSPSRGHSSKAVPSEIRENNVKKDGFDLRKSHKSSVGLKRILRMKVGDWPVYSFLLAFVRK